MKLLPSFQRPKITSAHIIAVVALAVGMAGSATAAVVITGQQIKNNSVSSKDIKDKSLLLKDFKGSERKKLKGATGATGPQGPIGLQGPAGTNGTNGTNGAAGASAFAPPPSGTLIKGGGILDGYASASTTLRGFSQLTFTAAAPLTNSGPDRNIWYAPSGDTANVEENAARCPGTFANPTPVAGNLCVYSIDSQNTNVLANSATLWEGASTLADGADADSFYNFVTSAGAGNMTFRYVWAYRAP